MKLMRDNQVRKLVECAIANSWRIEKTKRNHLKLISPKGQVIITSSTPSDHRTFYNLRSQLRKAGLVV